MSEQAKITDPISVPEAAELIGVSTTHITRLLRDGELVGQKMSARLWIVSHKSALAFSRNRPKLGRPPQE